MHMERITIVNMDENKFKVVFKKENYFGPVVEIESPYSFQVNSDASNLMDGLSWYLEDSLTFPTEPEYSTRSIITARDKWGCEAFNQLFKGDLKDRLREKIESNLSFVLIEIVSNNSSVLSWPWEVLQDENENKLGLDCGIVRINKNEIETRIEKIESCYLRVLLIITRSTDEKDIEYLLAGKSLMEVSCSNGRSISITVVRPSSLKHLEERLNERPGYYSVVHFDGHGEFSACTGDSTPKGRLSFGDFGYIDAKDFSSLLAKYDVPMVVLNACQSAKTNQESQASVATELLSHGICSVVAMSHSLYKDGARSFIGGFYQSLASGADIALAVLEGRRAMNSDPKRYINWHEKKLEDWLVPVFYTTDSISLRFKNSDPLIKNVDRIKKTDRHFFIGRDKYFFNLDQELFSVGNQFILIYGISGIGKTALLRNYVSWIESTGGVSFSQPDFCSTSFNKVFWFDCLNDDWPIYLVDELRLLAGSTSKADYSFVETLAPKKILVVLDGVDNDWAMDVKSNFDECLSRSHLQDVLNSFLGGGIKCIAISKSDNNWYTSFNPKKIKVSGLNKEEIWVLCNEIFNCENMNMPMEDFSYIEPIIDDIDGHPVWVRNFIDNVIQDGTDLSFLSRRLQNIYTENPEKSWKGNLYKGLDLYLTNLPEPIGSVYQLISLHRVIVNLDLLHQMVLSLDVAMTLDEIATYVNTFEKLGLMESLEERRVFRILPELARYLSLRFRPETTVKYIYSAVFANQGLGMSTAPTELRESEISQQYIANFQNALKMMMDIHQNFEIICLLEGLGTIALDGNNLDFACDCFADMYTWSNRQNYIPGMATAFFNQGITQKRLGEVEYAKKIQEESLSLSRDVGEILLTFMNLIQLGFISISLGELESAEQYLSDSDDFGREHNLENASMLCALGSLKKEKRLFDQAVKYYEQALSIAKKLSDELSELDARIALCLIFEEKSEIEKFNGCFLRAWKISERYKGKRLEDLNHIKGLYHLNRGEFDEAKDSHKESLALYKQNQDVKGIAGSYYQLGIIDSKLGNIEQAYEWYVNALNVLEKSTDSEGLHMVLTALGKLTLKSLRLDLSESYFLEALKVAESSSNPSIIGNSYADLSALRGEMGNQEEEQLFLEKSLLYYEQAGNLSGKASALRKLGILSFRKSSYSEGKSFFEKAISLYEKLGFLNDLADSYGYYGHELFRVKEYILSEEIFSKELDFRREGIGSECDLIDVLMNLAEILSIQNQKKKSISYFDKAEDLIHRIHDDSVRAKKYFDFSIKLKNSLEYGRAVTNCDHSIELLKKTCCFLDLAQACLMSGSICIQIGEYEKAEILLRNALETSIELEHESYMASSLFYLGLLYFNKSDLDKAEEYFIQSISYRKNNQFSEEIAETYNNLGYIQFSKSRFEAAIDWYKKTLEKKDKTESSEAVCKSYFMLAQSQEELKNLRFAKEYYLKGIDYSEYYDLNVEIRSILYYRLGFVELTMGNTLSFVYSVMTSITIASVEFREANAPSLIRSILASYMESNEEIKLEIRKLWVKFCFSSQDQFDAILEDFNKQENDG